MTTKPTSIEDAKRQAKLLRSSLSKEGKAISHSKSLELVAVQHGFRDWNTMHAAFGNRSAPAWQVGDRVSGRYLSQPFKAEIIAVQQVRTGWYRLTFQFDEPVDVVTFEGFSNFRHRTSHVIGPEGKTIEQTSNGEPHLRLDF